jgi:hypothetical protein
MMKDGSDKFIKKNVKDVQNNGKSKSQPAKKRRLTPGSDEIINAYPGSAASEAASPKVVSRDADLNLNVDNKKK